MVALLAASPVWADVTLNAGYKIEGELTGFVNTDTLKVPNGVFSFVKVRFNNLLEPSDIFQLDLFAQNDLSQPPAWSWQFTGDSGGDGSVIPFSNFGVGDFALNDFWTGLDGAYRLTMFSGTGDLAEISISTYDTVGDTSYQYTLDVDSFPPPVAIPEPGSLLLLSGSVCLLLRR
jgi:hypothetical protein